MNACSHKALQILPLIPWIPPIFFDIFLLFCSLMLPNAILEAKLLRRITFVSFPAIPPSHPSFLFSYHWEITDFATPWLRDGRHGTHRRVRDFWPGRPKPESGSRFTWSQRERSLGRNATGFWTFLFKKVWDHEKNLTWYLRRDVWKIGIYQSTRFVCKNFQLLVPGRAAHKPNQSASRSRAWPLALASFCSCRRRASNTKWIPWNCVWKLTSSKKIGLLMVIDL